jgi:H+-transporting ATP synthase F0 complex subunit s
MFNSNIRMAKKVTSAGKLYWHAWKCPPTLSATRHTSRIWLQNLSTRNYSAYQRHGLQVGYFGEKPALCAWPSYQPRRHLWGMLNMVANKPDKERIKEVGAERACAEWLLRCGAHIRWDGSASWQTDYNALPPATKASVSKGGRRIVEINADDASVMDVGFPHFDGITALKKIRFHLCAYLRDEAISRLVIVKDSLEHLEISSCDVSDSGLLSLASLQNLKTLLLYDLPEVRNKTETFATLKAALPNCEIDYKDIKKEE